mmetsp:Transcript_62320/g.108570  ORF Transcript_62320/g.108570 Transcript_62320/m.108570 type:complete len:106 (-) Transcript_62320:79-396(-)
MAYRVERGTKDNIRDAVISNAVGWWNWVRRTICLLTRDEVLGCNRSSWVSGCIWTHSCDRAVSKRAEIVEFVTRHHHCQLRKVNISIVSVKVLRMSKYFNTALDH